MVCYIDHNQYVHNDYVWQSNYCAGLRVLDEAGMNPEAMKERAYFDVAPECDTAEFSGNGVYYNALQIICLRLFIFFYFILIVGAWSVYPFFPSGNMIVQSIEKGLFVMKVSYFFCYLILFLTFFK
jgi:hypothetical protein